MPCLPLRACGQCVSGELMFGSSARHGALSCAAIASEHRSSLQLVDSQVGIANRRLAHRSAPSSHRVAAGRAPSQRRLGAEGEAPTEEKSVAARPAAELPRAVAWPAMQLHRMSSDGEPVDAVVVLPRDGLGTRERCIVVNPMEAACHDQLRLSRGHRHRTRGYS